MRASQTLLLSAFCLFLPLGLWAEEPASSTLTISLEPLGDTEGGVASRIRFGFASHVENQPEAPLFLQGSFLSGGTVLRNFRYPVPPETGGAVATVQVLPEASVDVEVRLVMTVDESAPLIIAKAKRTFAIARTDRPYVAGLADGAEAVFEEGVIPESLGAVTIRKPRRDVAPNLFTIDVEAHEPVTRIEFWVAGKKVLARNAPPFRAELDLGKLPKRVEVRAVGYDALGRYVDADAFVVSERDEQLEAHISRTMTPDGISHFRVSLQNPRNVALKSVVLYLGDKKVHHWERPPYALDLPTARLEGTEFVRVSVLDDTGFEASDIMFLEGARYMERIDVNVVELPVTVTDRTGAPVADLAVEDFTLLENGKPQKISNFSFASNLPISVGVLLDHSESMEPKMAEAKAAAIEFFTSIIGKNDRAFFGAFGTEPSRVAPFVSDLATLEAQVKALPKASGTTALYDAITTGLYRFRNVQGRKALVVISDGDDTSSRLAWEDIVMYARASRVPLYFIGIGYALRGLGSSAMKTLTADTGGMAFYIKNAGELSTAYEWLQRELHSQYILTYQTESSSKDDSFRTIEVKVDRPDARVRTIRGFIL